MAAGHRYTLVMASLTKMALQTEMPPEMRLEFLGHLENITDQVLTPEVIALVQPMDKAGYELYEEAAKLGFGPRGPNLFTVLDRKFDVFAALNPSLRDAIDDAWRPREQSAQ
jgi:hypothetical protein